MWSLTQDTPYQASQKPGPGMGVVMGIQFIGPDPLMHGIRSYTCSVLSAAEVFSGM